MAGGLPVSGPIVVNASPAPAQLTAGVRQTLLFLAGMATLYGATNVASTLNVLVGSAGIIAGVISFVLGQIHTRTAATNQAAMAAQLPNAIAVAK